MILGRINDKSNYFKSVKFFFFTSNEEDNKQE